MNTAPADLEVLHAQAFAAYEHGDANGARPPLTEILQRRPSDARALLLYGLTQAEPGSPVALAMVEAATYSDPEDVNGWYNLGVIEGERGALDAAARAYRRVVGLDPTHRDALGNGSQLLRRLEQFDEALAWAERRRAVVTPDWSAHLNRAICLFHVERWDEAEGEYLEAKRLAPGEAIAEWEHFAPLLFQRRFAEAWDAFESRFAVGDLTGVFAYPFPQPIWRGEPLGGKHLIVHNEQGLGDQLMFACALAEALEQSERTTVVVAPPLVDLFAASFPKADVLAAFYGRFAGDHPEPSWINGLSPADYQVPIGSLMAVLRRTPESFADPAPYLRPSDAARARWADFDAGPGLKVGLCWASNPALFRMDSARRAVRKSMELESLAPLVDVAGVSFVSVLNWPTPPQGAAAFGGALQDLSERLSSLDETAALIERLDIVITVDTAVAHLAGALGKETWLLLHHFPDCRWELQATSSYWYPNMRLFRQTTLGDWSDVVARVAETLRERVRA